MQERKESGACYKVYLRVLLIGRKNTAV